MFRNIIRRFREIFGFSHNSKYVKRYLDNANMRSGIFMSAIIVVLEMWMIIRYYVEDIIPDMAKDPSINFFQYSFQKNSGFWLLLSMGAVMFAYCLYFMDKHKNKPKTIVVLSIAAFSIILCCLFPFEPIKTLSADSTKLALLIAVYATILLFDISVIIATIYRYKGGNNYLITSAVVITLFALSCLAFGVRVSYHDYVKLSEPKMIICFLMMSLYVGCLLIWKPYISIGILGTIFLFFYLLITSFPDRKLPDGDVVNYVTFFISLTMVSISMYAQRHDEARKDEKLEFLATTDALTGIYSFGHFLNLVDEKRSKEKLLDKWCYVFFDILGFKIYNYQKGFTAGNEFLRTVSKILVEGFPDGYICRQADDHFVGFIPLEHADEVFADVNEKIKALDKDIQPYLIAGVCVYTKEEEESSRSVEKARYACIELKHNNMGRTSLYYDQEMHNLYRKKQYIVRHIDEAIENRHIKAFYQPVVWSKDGTLCGAESLARWEDPKYGFLNPGQFVGALEQAQTIYKLDLEILRIVCENLRHNIDHKLAVFPISINFSRIDFIAVDIVSLIDEIVTEYNVPKNLLHIEITESALTDDGDLLLECTRRLKKLGYSLWLDDFGSGYSSFNVLKDFEFDVLKLDMKFLEGFDSNEKAKVLIKSVVSLADLIGMKTLSEGVETEEQSQFLKTIKCGRLQGYHYSKPIPYEELMQKIDEKTFVVSKEID